MIKKGRKADSVKYYKPSPVLEDFINEKLQNLKTGKSSPNLNRMKVHILDKIFQSMADLTYFLEQIAVHPKLEESFRKDLQDLFDMRSSSQVKQLHPYFGVNMEGIRLQETAFTRLIFASILPDDERFLEYRLRMMHTLQSIVYAKTKFTMDANYGVYHQATKSSLNDLANAVGWTATIGGQKKEIEYNPSKQIWKETEYNPSRLFDFPAPYLKKSK